MRHKQSRTLSMCVWVCEEENLKEQEVAWEKRGRDEDAEARLQEQLSEHISIRWLYWRQRTPPHTPSLSHSPCLCSSLPLSPSHTHSHAKDGPPAMCWEMKKAGKVWPSVVIIEQHKSQYKGKSSYWMFLVLTLKWSCSTSGHKLIG